MTTASVTTDINIGPYKIPSNAQNMIMNNFAERNELKIEVVIPEPIMSDQLGTTQWLYKDFKFKNIILCSIHQLPKDKIFQDKIVNNLSEVRFNFAIEGLSGEGKNFFQSCFKEAKYFNNAEIIDTNKTNWIELHEKLKNEI
jgi:sporadic carbohydrate cluster protein (TIGR04323 family)|tara:strand:- start:8 stop:433 length:426 start_codon:yes stop_codon:yes gene_type:complete